MIVFGLDDILVAILIGVFAGYSISIMRKSKQFYEVFGELIDERKKNTDLSREILKLKREATHAAALLDQFNQEGG